MVLILKILISAHCITPIYVATGKPTVEHSKTFYTHFANILKLAEDLKIFYLPSQPDKFSRRSLTRFDQLDVEEFPLPSSCCPSYVIPNFSSESSSSTNEPNQTLRLQVQMTKKGKAIKKVFIFSSPFTLEHLFSLASQKFGVSNKFKKVVLGTGEIVYDNNETNKREESESAESSYINNEKNSLTGNSILLSKIQQDSLIILS